MGQLVGYHRMGRVRVDKKIFELRGGSPRPCQLRIDCLAPMSKFELCTGACKISWGPTNQVASVTAWSNHNRYSMVDVGGRMR
jgi:hypothetical protein